MAKNIANLGSVVNLEVIYQQLKKRNRGEIVVMCAWYDKVMNRKFGFGVTGISHGICPECEMRYFLGYRKRGVAPEGS